MVTEALGWDDHSGMQQDRGKVKEARQKEIEYVRKKEVWIKISRRQAIANGWKIINIRWIDINKGDDESPIYRSRAVAKEFNDGAINGLFAGTPPLEALRTLVSEAATISENGTTIDENVIMINDVARAFFEAKATRKVCIELPDEDKTPEDVGQLQMSLY